MCSCVLLSSLMGLLFKWLCVVMLWLLCFFDFLGCIWFVSCVCLSFFLFFVVVCAVCVCFVVCLFVVCL